MLRVITGLAFLSVAVTTAAENLIPNAGFETIENRAPVGWSHNPEVVTLVETNAHEGTRCLKVRTDKPINIRYGSPYTAITLADAVPVQGDKVYWVTLWTRCPRYGGGYPCLFYVRWLKADDTAASIEKVEVGADQRPHGWQLTRMPVVAPKDATKARIHLVVWAAYTDVFIDELGFGLADVLTPRRASSTGPRGKLRVMSFPEWLETPDEVVKVRDHGFNVTDFLYYRCYEQQHRDEIEANLKLAKKAKLPVLVAVWLSEVAPKEFREKHPLIAADGSAYKRTPSIFHQEWWDEWFRPVCLRFAKQSTDGSIVGLWVDFELYDEPNQVSSVCYCQRCLDEYEKVSGVDVSGGEVKERVQWLLDNDKMQGFRDFQATKLGSYAVSLRVATDKINPRFHYGDFPYYDHLADRVFAQKLGTEAAPFLIGPEWTYRLESNAYSNATAVQLAVCYCEEKQRQIREAGLKAWLLAGICPMTEAAFMRDKIVALICQTDGYWLWTKRIIDHHRAAFDGKPKTDAEAEAAWQALKEANEKVAGMKD